MADIYAGGDECKYSKIHLKWVSEIKDRVRAVLTQLTTMPLHPTSIRGAYAHQLTLTGGYALAGHIVMESSSEAEFISQLETFYKTITSDFFSDHTVVLSYVPRGRENGLLLYSNTTTSGVNVDAMVASIDEFMKLLWCDSPMPRKRGFVTTGFQFSRILNAATELPLLELLVHTFIQQQRRRRRCDGGKECRCVPWSIANDDNGIDISIPTTKRELEMIRKFCPWWIH